MRFPAYRFKQPAPALIGINNKEYCMIAFKRYLVLLVIACSSLALSQEMQEGRLMRFPDIHKDKVVFVYAGDLWLASTSGGVAHRITSHPGRELFPKFSPDGKWIAFTGQYDGNFNVYVMASEGGQPKQLTFYQGGLCGSTRFGRITGAVTDHTGQ